MCDTDRKIRVYIYGAGGEYNRFSSRLELLKDEVEVMGVVTTMPQAFNRIDGYDVIRPTEMNISEMDYVIIAALAWKEIVEVLYKVGIDEEKIIRASVFDVPQFNLREYFA